MSIRCFILVFIFFITSCVTQTHLLAIPKKELPLPSPQTLKPKVILVLGSGSSRGFAHAGVLKVLENNHIPIDMIIGTSAGSIVGALYADRPSAQHLEKLLLKTNRNEVINFSLFHLSRGFFNGSQMQQFLVKNMHAETFEKLKIPFFAVATDLETGKAHVFGSGPIAPAVNASAAVPAFFSPVNLYGKTFVDGGLVDPVAVDVALRFHPAIIIAVNLNASISKELPSLIPGVVLRGLDLMMTKLNAYSVSKAEVVITPKIMDTPMFDGSNRELLIRAGEKATIQMLPKIKQLMAKYHLLSR